MGGAGGTISVGRYTRRQDGTKGIRVDWGVVTPVDLRVIRGDWRSVGIKSWGWGRTALVK